jgi:hypothetical protein
VTGWLDDAACRGRPIAWWYPEPGAKFSTAVALNICRGCPVRGDCLDEALAAEAGTPAVYRYGVRGAKTPAGRQSIERSRHRAHKVVTTNVTTAPHREQEPRKDPAR